jgi:hypothetical protein
MCKVQWSHIGEGEATWKREEELHIDFPHYSLVFPKSRGRDFFKGGRICNTHFVRKSKRRNYIPLCTCVPSLFIISCEHLIKNKGLIKVIKWCIMLRFILCAFCDDIKIE